GLSSDVRFAHSFAQLIRLEAAESARPGRLRDGRSGLACCPMLAARTPLAVLPHQAPLLPKPEVDFNIYQHGDWLAILSCGLKAPGADGLSGLRIETRE